MVCDYCTSTTFWLMDNEALGPCVCCTPEGMAALACERNEAMAMLDEAGDTLASYLRRHGMDTRAVKLEDPDLDLLNDLLGS